MVGGYVGMAAVMRLWEKLHYAMVGASAMIMVICPHLPLIDGCGYVVMVGHGRTAGLFTVMAWWSGHGLAVASNMVGQFHLWSWLTASQDTAGHGLLMVMSINAVASRNLLAYWRSRSVHPVHVWFHGQFTAFVMVLGGFA
jgi:hypothetical protein